MKMKAKVKAKAKVTGDKQWVAFKFHAPPGAKVYLAGTFNGWNPKGTKLNREADGVYGVSFMLPKGTYEYKFVVNGVWQHDPNGKAHTPNEFGSLNSVLVVGKPTQHKTHPHTFESLVSKDNKRLWTAD
jgi:1,4-alpha-glucan branching enzyme